MEQDTYQFDPEQFNEANKDYLDRIKSQGLKAIYDATLDTLFLEIGEPREALTEHFVDNIMLRIDPKTLQVIGLEILDFLDDFLPANRVFRNMLRDWEISRDTDSELAIMEPQYAPLKDVVEAAIGRALQMPMNHS